MCLLSQLKERGHPSASLAGSSCSSDAHSPLPCFADRAESRGRIDRRIKSKKKDRIESNRIGVMSGRRRRRTFRIKFESSVPFLTRSTSHQISPFTHCLVFSWRLVSLEAYQVDQAIKHSTDQKKPATGESTGGACLHPDSSNTHTLSLLTLPASFYWLNFVS